MVIGDLRGCVFAGATGGYVSGAWAALIRRVLVHRSLICRSLILPAAWERGLKEKWREAKNPTNIRKRYFRK